MTNTLPYCHPKSYTAEDMAGEIAGIWAHLLDGRTEDAMLMCEMLTPEELRKQAYREMLEEDDDE